MSCGVRAAAGAVSRAAWDDAAGRLRLTVLGPEGDRPLGLCGSGVIDVVAALRRAGIIAPSGRLDEGAAGVMRDQAGVGRGYVLAPADRTALERDLVLTLQDVRQIQLAKAALAVGVKFLMRRMGVSRIDRLVLTGAFGASFDWRSAAAIGMLPGLDVVGRVETVENAAGLGAVMALVNAGHRVAAEELARRVSFVELADEQDFGLEYPLAMTFPDPVP